MYEEMDAQYACLTDSYTTLTAFGVTLCNAFNTHGLVSYVDGRQYIVVEARNLKVGISYNCASYYIAQWPGCPGLRRIYGFSTLLEVVLTGRYQCDGCHYSSRYGSYCGIGMLTNAGTCTGYQRAGH